MSVRWLLLGLTSLLLNQGTTLDKTSERTMRNCRIRRVTKRVYKAGLLMPLDRSKSCRGQTLIEFALVAMTFFLLSFALIDFSWLMFNQMNMQDAVREAGRYASTGNHLPNSDPKKPGVLSRSDSITQVLQQAASGTNYTVQISSVSGGAVSAGAGGPNDTVNIKAICDIPLLTGVIGTFFGSSNKFHFTVSSTFKNEPFSPTQTN